MNWKGVLIQAFTFWGLPCLGALAAWFALRRDRLDGWDRRRWLGLAILLFVLTRFGTHILVFHVFRYAGGYDLLDVWVPIAREVLAGRDPGLLVDNLYGPLFPLVLAFGYGISGGRYAPGIDLPFVVADAMSLVLLFRISFPALGEALARRVTLAVLLSPLLWHGVVVRTQDEPLFVMFLLLALDAFLRRQEVRGVLFALLGTLFTKAIFPFWVLPVLLAAGGGLRRTGLRVAAAGALTVGALLVFQSLGPDLTGRLSPTLDARGSSLWMLAAKTGHPSKVAFHGGLAATAVAMVFAAWLAAGPGRGGPSAEAAARGVVAVQGVFFVLSPFTLPPHLVHGLPFLAWQAIRGGKGNPTWTAALLAAAFVLFQIPALGLGSEFWSGMPVLILLLVPWCGWTAWIALRDAQAGGNPAATGKPGPVA